MVISYIIGGIGNQMFQYAAGKALAKKLKTAHKLYIEDYYKYDDRNYGLSCFKIEPEFVNKTEVDQFKYIKLNNPFLKPLQYRVNLLTEKITNKTYYKEKDYHFDLNFFNLTGDIYLDGYWQSYKYFEEIQPEIKADFTFKILPNKKNQQLIELMSKENSVAVHIRRGDYLQPKFYKLLGCVGLDYYQRSIRLIEQLVNKPSLYVFSDDPKWVKQNIKSKSPITFITHNQDKDFEDLRLMSCCKHQIIANSSFSWWGAWLNNQQHKIVISPKRYFVPADQNSPDRYPDDWILL